MAAFVCQGHCVACSLTTNGVFQLVHRFLSSSEIGNRIHVLVHIQAVPQLIGDQLWSEPCYARSLLSRMVNTSFIGHRPFVYAR